MSVVRVKPTAAEPVGVGGVTAAWAVEASSAGAVSAAARRSDFMVLAASPVAPRPARELPRRARFRFRNYQPLLCGPRPSQLATVSNAEFGIAIVTVWVVARPYCAPNDIASVWYIEYEKSGLILPV